MHEDGLLVGVDFTVDRLRLMLTEVDGDPVQKGEWPLPALATEDDWSWEVGGRIATAFAEEGSGRFAEAIAVAAPGGVDPIKGRLTSGSGRAEWDGMRVVDALRRHIDAPVAVENRVEAAMLGETWQGAGAGLDHVLYVSLRGVPQAAILSGGRAIRGARFGAGALPAFPELPPGATVAAADIEHIAGLIADAAALLDPEALILDAAPDHLDAVVPLVERTLAAITPKVRVARAELSMGAALVGAIRIASTLAFEGHRKP